MIVATAGHVDHGKTTLVRALTGVDTDRLPEEKARGLTIDLGFAYRGLPSGEIVGFVDVPGHERFVRTMVAGVAGIDLALLVIAADDGVMPQSREHVAVLDLLGITRALVALTKADRVDAARLAVVTGEIGRLLAPTAMAGAPVLPVAAPLGQGIDDLWAALAAAAVSRETPAAGGGFRLAVDRVFVLKGAGTVATGTVFAGRVAVGDRVVVLPQGREARVRSIHAQDRPAEGAGRGERAALNLVGVETTDLARGSWIATPGLLQSSPRLDVRLTVLAAEDMPLKHGTPVHVHHGAGHVPGRVALLEGGGIAPGSRGWAQLVLDRPLVAAWGDRVVLRDQSARRTIAGGHVVDPEGPARGRARPERLARLVAMDEPDPALALSALLASAGDGVDLAAFARARNLPQAEAGTLFAATAMVRIGRADERRGVAPDRWEQLQGAILAAVAADHARRTDRLGPTVAELGSQAALAAGRALLAEAVAALATQGRLVRRGAIVHMPGHAVSLAAADRQLWQRVEALLAVAGTPPALFPLAEALALAPSELERLLERLASHGLVQKIARNRWLTPAQVECFVAAAARAADAAGPEGFAAARFRDTAGIGRNLAIDVIEFLDRSGVTRRHGDLRTLVSRESP